MEASAKSRRLSQLNELNRAKVKACADAEVHLLLVKSTQRREGPKNYLTCLNYASYTSFGDNKEDVQAAYAQHMGLLGLMVWSLETDDFHAQCSSRPFPLIKTLVETFTGAPITTPSPPSTSSPIPTTTRDPDATTAAGQSTTTTTTTTTTTAKPTTFPTAAPGEHCSYPGNNPDPNDCSIFYQCVYTGSVYLETVAECPPGSLFNPETFICDYDYAVCALDPSYCPANCPV